jgi:hypothetical protein
MVRREWRSLRQPHAEFALELDRTYKHYHRLVACLREYPHTELKRHHRYIKRRVASLAYNTGLFSGSMERLGIVPVLGVLYLQFKDWKFGDWTSLWGSVHIVGGLLLWALLLAYLASWWLIRLRSRLEAYEALLTEALEEDAAE